MTSTLLDRFRGVNSGLAIKAPVRAATTGNITLSGLQTIDGVSCVSGDRVLVKNQTSSVDNGIYVVDTGTWTRDVDMNGNRDIVQGSLVYVTSGSTQGTTVWQVTSGNPITIGSSAITYTRGLFSGLASTTFIQAGTGAVSRAAQDKMRERISLLDFGADPTGVADSTTAVQAVLNLMQPSTNYNGNPKIYAPAGTYKVSSTLSPVNSASNFVIEGDGKDSTVLVWNGSAGIPMFKFINPRSIWMDDLSLYGKSSAKPSAMVQYHRASGGTIGAATGFCGLRNVRIGDGTGDHTKAVVTSADGGQDSNNEQHIFENVDVIAPATYGYHFSHSNSLLHRIYGGSIQSYGTAAISNDCAGANNSSFYVFGTAFAGSNDSVIFEVGNPRVAIEIYSSFHENVAATNTKVLSEIAGAPFVGGALKIYGGYYHMNDPTTTSTIVWNGDADSVLEFHGSTITSPSGVTFNFKGAGRVTFFGGANTTNSLTYNGETTLLHTKEGAGAPTYTQAGVGTLRLVRSAGSSNLDVSEKITSGATFSASGRSTEGLIILEHGGATNVTAITNGYVGQIITLFANNGNTTLVHAVATNAPYLQGGANFTMSAGNSITLRKAGSYLSNVWVEMGRKT
jgi:hypothetical protein